MKSKSVNFSQIFSSDPLVAASDNHCVPVYDVLHVPEDEDIDVTVMALLLHYMHPPSIQLGKPWNAFDSYLKDCTTRNVIVDPKSFYLDAFHSVNPEMKRDYSGPARFKARTEGHLKYIFIDFGLSRRYGPSVLEPRDFIVLTTRYFYEFEGIYDQYQFRPFGRIRRT